MNYPLRLLLVSVFFLLCLLPLCADMGIGIIAGQPTGVSFRMDHFPVLGAAWSFLEYIHFHADFWFLDFVIYDPIEMYIGAGGKVRVFTTDAAIAKNQDTPVSLGVRIPVGIRYFPIPEIELFLEICPGINLFPKTTLDIDAGIGIRYIFAR